VKPLINAMARPDLYHGRETVVRLERRVDWEFVVRTSHVGDVAARCFTNVRKAAM
jgi:hypothetical protein